jgi:hypothetical protein
MPPEWKQAQLKILLHGLLVLLVGSSATELRAPLVATCEVKT